MQKKLIVVAVTGALAAPLAFAQSNVSIYGIADVGVEWGNSGNGSKFRVQSGQASGSRLGLKGSEALGAGLTANFILELGVAYDNGQITSHGTNTGAGYSVGSNQAATTTGTVLFSRQAWAGIAGGFGAVQIGRQFTPIYKIASKADPAGLGTVATLNNLWSQGSRADNSINYTTPTWGGFTLDALYSTGVENNVNNNLEDAGREWGLNGQWSNGPLWLGVGYQERNGTSLVVSDVSETKNWLAGVSYDFGMFKLFGSYNSGKTTTDTPATTLDARVWAVGATIKAGPGVVTAVVGDRNDKLAADADGRLYGVGYNYPLSKRTDVYAFWATMRNKNSAAFTLSSATTTGLTPTAGYDPKALQIGLRHTF